MSNLSTNGQFALDAIKKYYCIEAFSAADLTKACGQTIHGQTLTSLVNHGYLNNLGGSPTIYQYIGETLHDSLRQRIAQHAPKNTKSKKDDAIIKIATNEVIQILKEKYPNHIFEHRSALKFTEIEEYCQRLFDLPDYDYNDRRLLPDGGVIWMDNKYPILISEMKRQGTNDERLEEGKAKQASGNAIERLGKNLIGYKVLYEQEDILPFICFLWGCDCLDGTVQGKLYTLNSFYKLNTLYTGQENKYNKPFTFMTLADRPFSKDELVQSLLKITDYSIKYFEDKENN